MSREHFYSNITFLHTGKCMLFVVNSFVVKSLLLTVLNFKLQKFLQNNCLIKTFTKLNIIILIVSMNNYYKIFFIKTYSLIIGRNVYTCCHCVSASYVVGIIKVTDPGLPTFPFNWYPTEYRTVWWQKISTI